MTFRVKITLFNRFRYLLTIYFQDWKSVRTTNKHSAFESSLRNEILACSFGCGCKISLSVLKCVCSFLVQ